MRDEFMMTRQGKQYVLFAGLLDEAHSRGLVGIDTDLIQVPEDSNGQVAIVKATVQMEENPGSGGTKTYSGIGDASPQNVSRNIVPHLLRIAETRAKARALRDAVNVSATALEEISDNDAPPENSQGRQTQSSPAAEPAQRTQGGSRPAANVRDLPRKQSGSHQEETATRTQAGDGSSAPPEDRTRSKAPKSQIDFIKTLAEDLAGPQGAERLEGRIGKPLSELTREEAEQWIDRLTPRDTADKAAE